MPTPTYKISGALGAYEGVPLNLTLTTTGLTAGDIVTYTISGIDASRIAGGALTGSVKIGANGTTGLIPISIINNYKFDGTSTLNLSIENGQTTYSLNVVDTSIPDTRNLIANIDLTNSYPFSYIGTPSLQDYIYRPYNPHTLYTASFINSNQVTTLYLDFFTGDKTVISTPLIGSVNSIEYIVTENGGTSISSGAYRRVIAGDYRSDTYDKGLLLVTTNEDTIFYGLLGADTRTLFYGNTGNDTMYGGSGINIFNPGGGENLINGGTGINSYNILTSDTATNTIVTNGGSDTLRFYNDSSFNPILRREKDDLIIQTFDNKNLNITIKNQFKSGNGISLIQAIGLKYTQNISSIYETFALFDNVQADSQLYVLSDDAISALNLSGSTRIHGVIVFGGNGNDLIKVSPISNEIWGSGGKNTVIYDVPSSKITSSSLTNFTDFNGVFHTLAKLQGAAQDMDGDKLFDIQIAQFTDKTLYFLSDQEIISSNNTSNRVVYFAGVNNTAPIVGDLTKNNTINFNYSFSEIKVIAISSDKKSLIISSPNGLNVITNATDFSFYDGLFTLEAVLSKGATINTEQFNKFKSQLSSSTWTTNLTDATVKNAIELSLNSNIKFIDIKDTSINIIKNLGSLNLIESKISKITLSDDPNITLTATQLNSLKIIDKIKNLGTINLFDSSDALKNYIFNSLTGVKESIILKDLTNDIIIRNSHINSLNLSQLGKLSYELKYLLNGIEIDVIQNNVKRTITLLGQYPDQFNIISQNTGSINTASLQWTSNQVEINNNLGFVNINTPNGKDTIEDIHRIKFLDKSIALDVLPLSSAQPQISFSNNLNSLSNSTTNFSQLGNAGLVAEILGASFGKSSLSNAYYVGIGLSLLDSGTSFSDLLQLALQVANFGKTPTVNQEIQILYQNILGLTATPSDLDYWSGLVGSGQFTHDSLAVFAATSLANKVNIDLVGLANTGIFFTPQ